MRRVFVLGFAVLMLSCTKRTPTADVMHFAQEYHCTNNAEKSNLESFVLSCANNFPAGVVVDPDKVVQACVKEGRELICPLHVHRYIEWSTDPTAERGRQGRRFTTMTESNMAELNASSRQYGPIFD